MYVHIYNIYLCMGACACVYVNDSSRNTMSVQIPNAHTAPKDNPPSNYSKRFQ